MRIDFKDIKGVEVKEFSISGTYDGHLEGSYQSVSRFILANNQSKKGLLFLQPELVDGTLKPYVYKLYACSDWEHRLELVWYDDDIPFSMSLTEYIQQKTINNDFQPNCLFFDLDNL